MKKRFLLTATILAVFVSVPRAQSIWFRHNGGTTFAFEFLKPNFQQGDASFLTSAFFVNVWHSLSERFVLVAEVPFAHVGFEGRFRSETALGNPYFGIELHRKRALVASEVHLFAELGVRAPLAPKELEDGFTAAFVGVSTELVERLGAYVEMAMPVSAAGNLHYKTEQGFSLRLRTGLTTWIGVEQRDENEWFLLYSGLVGYEIGKFQMLGGLSGRQWLSGEGEDIPQAFHQLGLMISMNFGTVRPGVYFRLPLYDLDLEDAPAPNVDWVFGVNLAVQLR